MTALLQMFASFHVCLHTKQQATILLNRFG